MADVEISVGANLTALRQELVKTTGMSAKEAKALVGNLVASSKRAEKEAKKAAAASARAHTRAAKDTQQAWDKAGKGIEGMIDRVLPGFSSLKGEIEQFAPAAGTMGSSIAGLAGPIAIATAGLTGLAAASWKFSDSAASFIDNMTSMSNKTGLSTDVLMGLDYALQQGGGSLEKASGGLMALNERLVQVAKGSKEATDNFAAYGIETRALDGSMRSTEDILRDVVNTVGGLDNPSEKAAAAVRLLGNEGAELVARLGGSTAALDENIAKNRELGFVIDNESRAAAAAYSEAMADFKRETSAAGQAIGEDLLPVVTDLVRDLTALVGPLIEIGSGLAWVHEQANRFNFIMHGSRAALKWFGEETDETSESVDRFGESIVVYEEFGESVQEAYKPATRATRAHTKALKDQREALAQVVKDGKAGIEDLTASEVEAARVATEALDAKLAAKMGQVEKSTEGEDKTGERERASLDETLNAASHTYGAMSGLVEQFAANSVAATEEGSEAHKKAAKQQFAITQGIRVGEAVMNTAAAVLQGIAMFGPPPSPAGIAAIASAAAIGATQIAAIAAAPTPQFHTGLQGIGHSGPNQPDERIIRVTEPELPRLDPRNGDRDDRDRPIVVQQVHRHRVFESFIADNLRLPSSGIVRKIRSSSGGSAGMRGR